MERQHRGRVFAGRRRLFPVSTVLRGDQANVASPVKGFKDEMALYDAVPKPYGEIFAMRSDGSDLRQLTDNKWEDASAACAPGPR